MSWAVAAAGPGSRRPPRMTHFSRRLLPAAKAAGERQRGAPSAGQGCPAFAQHVLPQGAQVQLRAHSRAQRQQRKKGFGDRVCDQGTAVPRGCRWTCCSNRCCLERRVPLSQIASLSPGTCIRPDLAKFSREALAEGAGGGFSWDVPGHVP